MFRPAAMRGTRNRSECPSDERHDSRRVLSAERRALGLEPDEGSRSPARRRHAKGEITSRAFRPNRTGALGNIKEVAGLKFSDVRIRCRVTFAADPFPIRNDVIGISC